MIRGIIVEICSIKTMHKQVLVSKTPFAIFTGANTVPLKRMGNCCLSRPASILVRILTMYTSCDVFPRVKCRFGVALIQLHMLMAKYPKTRILGREYGFYV